MSLRTVLAEQGGDESVFFCTLLNQTTEHGGKFGDLCSRPSGKRAVGENPLRYRCATMFVRLEIELDRRRKEE